MTVVSHYISLKMILFFLRSILDNNKQALIDSRQTSEQAVAVYIRQPPSAFYFRVLGYTFTVLTTGNLYHLFLC